MDKFFSILIPVYNVEKYINECFESILNQSFRDFEAIVIDDGSTDGCSKICDRYGKKYPEIFKIYHKENGGLISARRAAIPKANGQYCIFLDSDDKLAPNCLEVLYNTIKRCKTDMVIYSFKYFDDNETFKEAKKPFESGTIFDTEQDKHKLYSLLCNSSAITSIWSKAIKTELLQSDPTDYSPYFSYNMAEDLLQSLYPITYSKSVVYIEDALYYYRYNQTSISRSYTYQTIKNKSTLHVYKKLKEYMKIWGSSEDILQQVEAKQFNETVYLMINCYNSANNGKNRTQILKFPWHEMLPQDLLKTINNNKYVNKLYLELWNLIKNNKPDKVRLLLLKNNIYNKYKQHKKNKNVKKVYFLTASMSGGGAERVISLLAGASAQKGYQTHIILTDQSLNNAVGYATDGQVKLISLVDRCKGAYKLRQRAAWYSARICEKFGGKKNSNKALILKYKARNYEKYKIIKKLLKSDKNKVAIAFLNNPIFLTLLGAGGKTRVIISERNNPAAFSENKTTMAFIKNMYGRADAMVFQTEDAKQWYEKNTVVNAVVIPNPVKDGLPERYEGERSKKIVNFCRISSQKNLFLLVDAFERFCQKNDGYELYIYGEASGNGSEHYKEDLEEYIKGLKCKQKIFILDFVKDIHNLVCSYAMFVSSSDFEGMSNSMLEAMAIGLPCICTDCPAGGARAVIENRQNGMLVEVGNPEQLSHAMHEVANDKELAKKLSVNGTKIRQELSVKNISKRWISLINGGKND